MKARGMLFAVIGSFVLFAADAAGRSVQTGRPAPVYSRVFDVNRFSIRVNNDAMLGLSRNPATGPLFDLDGVPLVFSAGLYLAAKVNDRIHASAADFISDFAGGIFVSPTVPFGRGDSTFRVYKIGLGGPAHDREQWPARYGAPVDSSGQPLGYGDQTLWSTFVDGFAEERESEGCLPLNAEVHLTVWGWQRLDNVVFLRYQIVNRSDTAWTDAYVGMFVDADVASPSNDLVGSDGRLRLVYTYDAPGKLFFDEPGAAVGFSLIEAPLKPSPGDTALTLFGPVAGFRSVPVYAPWIAKYWPRNWLEPRNRMHSVARSIWYRLQGLDVYGQPAIDRSTGYTTFWAFSGDPITGRGWLDTLACDRRMMISAGPFELAPDDTVTFGLGVFGVLNRDVLGAVDALKQEVGAVRSAIASGAGLFTEPSGSDLGDSLVQVPVRFVRLTKIRRLSLTLRFDPQVLEFAGLNTRNVASVNAQIGPEGVVALELEGISRNEEIAADTVGILKFRIKPDAPVGRYAYELSEIRAETESGRELLLPAVSGHVALWRLPQAPRLLAPPDGGLAENLTVHFRWTDDTTAGPNRYALTLRGRFKVARSVRGNETILPTSSLYWLADSTGELRWWTEITNRPRRIPSADTFRIRLRPLESLGFLGDSVACRLPLDTTEVWEIGQVVWNDPHVVVLARSRSGQGDMLVAARWDGHTLRTEGRVRVEGAVCLAARGRTAVVSQSQGLVAFQLRPDSGWVRAASGAPHEALVEVLLRQDWIFGIDTGGTVPRLVVHRLTGTDSLPLVGGYALAEAGERKLPLCRPQRLALRDTLLFVGNRSVWIFSIRDPARPVLLSRIAPEVGGVLKLALTGKSLVVAFAGEERTVLAAYDVSLPESPRKLMAEEVPMTRSDLLLTLGDRVVVPFASWVAITHVQPGRRWHLDRLDWAPRQCLWSVTPEFVLASDRGSKLVFWKHTLPLAVDSSSPRLPERFSVQPAFPNPFNGSVRLVYYIPQTCRVRLAIFDVLGRPVYRIDQGIQTAGKHAFTWDGRDQLGRVVPSGVYLVRFRAGHQLRTLKVVCVR